MTRHELSVLAYETLDVLQNIFPVMPDDEVRQAIFQAIASKLMADAMNTDGLLRRVLPSTLVKDAVPTDEGLVKDLKPRITASAVDAPSLSDEKPNLNPAERRVLSLLAEAWNMFLMMPTIHPDEQLEFKLAIHNAQLLIARRVARRVDPDRWI